MTHQPIRVLSTIEADYVSGAAKNLVDFARRNQEEAQIAHAVLVYQRAGAPENRLISALRELGVPTFVVPESGRFDLSVIRTLRSAASEWRADIVETHNVKSHLLVRASGLWRRRKWIAFHHGFTAEDMKMRLYNLTTRWSLRAPHRVATVCGAFADQLTARGVDGRRVVVQHNAIAPFEPAPAEMVESARERIGAPEGSALLIAIGRLSSEKGHVDLVDAVALLRKQGLEVHLAIAGEGPERPRLLEQARQQGIEGNVILLGLQQDVRPYYMLADVVVLPSHSEGSPNVLPVRSLRRSAES